MPKLTEEKREFALEWKKEMEQELQEKEKAKDRLKEKNDNLETDIAYLKLKIKSLEDGLAEK